MPYLTALDINSGTYLEDVLNSGYNANIVSLWIPSLDNGRLEEKLKNEKAVADIGCGHGISTIIMAKAYPNSKFIGYDVHHASIERARELAREEGLSEDQIMFEVYSATDYPFYLQTNEQYDLIAFLIHYTIWEIPWALPLMRGDHSSEMEQ